MKMNRISLALALTIVGTAALSGCGGGGGGTGGTDLSTATFANTVIRSTVGTTTVFSHINDGGVAVGSTVIAPAQ